MTALDIVQSALRLIGSLGQGEIASAEEGQDGLQRLNDRIDLWNADGTYLYSRSQATYGLQGAKQTYSFGTGADFDGPRPVMIEAVSVSVARASLTLDDAYWLQHFNVETIGLPDRFWRMLKDSAPTVQFPVQLVESPFEWLALIEQSALANAVCKAFCDYAYPKVNLSFWPTPLSGALKANVIAWIPLQAFDKLDTVADFPPAYRKALQYTLAMDMAAEYGAVTSPEVQAGAQEAVGMIRAVNSQFQKRTEATLAEARQQQAQPPRPQ